MYVWMLLMHSFDIADDTQQIINKRQICHMWKKCGKMNFLLIYE